MNEDGRMTVLITGASGFLGGHLAELFVEAGHRARGLVRTTSKTEVLERFGVEIVRGDLKDNDSLRRAVAGVDVVVHAASTMSGIPQEYEEATIKGTRALLAAAEDAGVSRFVHVSSVGVYPIARVPKGRAITEDTPYEDHPALLTNYAKSKIGAERAALEFAERGPMAVVVLRPGILYGPRRDWNLSRMGYALGANRYVIVGSGRNPLPVCYVRNCAKAALLAAESPNAPGGVFNIVDDELFTQKEYLRRLRREVRPRMKIMRMPYVVACCLGALAKLAGAVLGRPSPMHPAHLITCRRRLAYSNERARRVLGWRPEVGKEAALAETMGYYAARERHSRRASPRELGRPVAGKPPLTACLVGCGVIAQSHLTILGRMKNAKVLALCDTDLEAAGELAGRFNVPRTYDDLETMLETEKPQVLHILTPPQSHARYAELAAEKGCNVLVEKPMAVDGAEARRMVRCAARHGVQICVDHNHLYDPVMVRARRLVESGTLGDIVWVESYIGFDLGSSMASRYMAPGGEKHWTFELPGGLYQNLAPHPLCLVHELLGEPTEVHAYARYGRVLPHAPSDELRILLQTPNAFGLASVSVAASPRLQYLTIFGTRMIVFVDLLNKWLVSRKVMRGVPKPISRAMMNLRHGSTVLWGTLKGMLKVLSKRWSPYDGMDTLIREFYASLQSGQAPPVSAEEAIGVMDVMDQVWRQLGAEKLHPPHAEQRDDLNPTEDELNENAVAAAEKTPGIS